MNMQVVVDSLLTNYQRSGSQSKTILLLHGWGDDLRTFSELEKELSKSFTVVSVDLPGFGGTQVPESVWGLEDYAQFAAAFLKKINIKSLYAVVAHSNGAAVAIYGTAKGVLQPERLVLLGAAGIRDQQKGKRLAIKVVAKTGKVATFWLPEHHRKRLQKKLYGTVGSDMLVVPQLQETFKKTVRQDVQAEAKQLMVPTLLIYGQNDKATPPMYGEIYHNLIDGSTLEIVGEAEHFVHHDQPAKVSKLIQEFLR